MSQSRYLFTSESVSEGHPDKIADQISDGILDGLLSLDPHARVACETLVKTGLVVIAGEISTKTWVDVEQIARKIISDIGYTHPDLGFDAYGCGIIHAIGKQSPDIAQGIAKANQQEQGAGDQGLMFGYACDETTHFMPAPIMFANQLMLAHAKLRKSKTIPWLRPDAKAQVTFAYEKHQPLYIDSIVLSTQHDPEIEQAELKQTILEELIKPTLPSEYLTTNTQYFINPTGRFVIGGPMGDCGLTGRKIIVDTYGGAARHGGGAFSGKDPSKVDRSASYMARHLAKQVVAAKLASRCEIQIAYAIGVAEPVALYVNTFGTSQHSDTMIEALLTQHFDLRPQAIIEYLDLLRPIYQKTASYGHFGRTEPEFTWEKTEKARELIL